MQTPPPNKDNQFLETDKLAGQTETTVLPINYTGGMVAPSPYFPHEMKAEEKAGFDIRDFMYRIQRRKWLILTIVTIVTVMAAVSSSRQKSIFVASATVEIGTNKSQMLLKDGDFFYVDDSQELETAAFLIKSYPLLELAAAKLELDQNKNFLDVTQERSILDVIKNKGTKKDKKNNDDDDLGLAKSFRIDKIFARKDGGAYLVSEFYELVISTSYSKYGTTTTYHYFSNDILVVDVDSDGSIDWFNRIPKRQHEINQYKYSSYISALIGDKLAVVFNDNPRNLEIEDDEKSAGVYGSFKKTNCMMYLIDKTKTTTKKELFRNNEIETILCPMKSRVVDENTIILYAEKGKNNDVKLGKLTITP